MTVNLEFMERWATALESDEYPQGRQHLNKNGQYCCVGVACELLNIPKADDSDGIFYYGAHGEQQIVPMEVITVSGLNTEDFNPFYNMNDGENYYENNPQSFKQIAQYIRRKYL